MFKPINFFTPTSGTQNPNDFGSTLRNRGNNSPTSVLGPNVNPSIRSGNDFDIFNSVLQKAYQKLAQGPEQIKTPNQDNRFAQFKPVEKITSEQAAGNILDFIQQRLAADKANGASTEKLNQSLNEAQKGFEKGFAEAKNIIEGMGLMSDKLSDEISDTYQRVTDGIEALRNAINEPSSGNSISRIDSSTEYSQNRSFSLDLVTQDGDKVSIDIRRSLNASESTSYQNSDGQESLQLDRQFSFSGQFELNVQGELDEDELQAINNLLSDVDSIANDFYSGRLDQAFNAATQINFDASELSSLDLDLKQTTRVSAITAYQSNSELPEQPPVPNIGDLFSRVDKLVKEAESFLEPRKLINDIADGLNLIDSQLSNDSEGDEPSVEQKQLNAFKNNLNSILDNFFSSKEET
ncbi:DUF5610 domain-containing protein [Pleionea sediminis]|uniref:DUF5610 domain-containing protein n=1 Tax=Pleionea sediminis TaxID=2569479 RepID=UPI0011848833|nr:DUF5610 domain-containing protein [Pleionea sediminis]